MNEPFITQDALDKLGIDLAGQDKETMLAHLNNTLEERIGTEITESLSESQLEELVTLQESGSDEAVNAWLVQQVPNLQDIVNDHVDVLLGELVENADDVNNA